MKVLLFIVLSLMIASSTAAVCRVFTCGNIDQSEGSNFCVQEGTDDPKPFTSQACSGDNSHCQAFLWNTPADSTATADCGATAPPTTFPAPFVPVAGAGLDGDWCDVVANCFTSNANAATCVANTCTAATNAGDACTVDSDCPMDHGCSAADNVCTVLADPGTVCANELACKWGTTCAQKDGDADAMCVTINSWANGVQFTIPQAPLPTLGAEPVGAAVCDSGFAVAVTGGNMQCRGPNKSATQGLDGRSTAEVGGTCAYNTFSNEDPAEDTTAVAATTTSMCGFNKDNRAYCVEQPGDDFPQEVAKEARKLFKDVMCHRLSGAEGSVCRQVKLITDEKFGFKLVRVGLNGGDAQTAANVANNDECVAETVTSNLWQGHFGDSALTYGVFGVCASMLTFILF